MQHIGVYAECHKADEYVNIEEMKTAAKIMALSAVNLLGLEE